MKQIKKNDKSSPGSSLNVETLEYGRKRVNHNERFLKLLRSTIYTLIVAAACSVLVTVLFMPVLRICGNSPNPTLNEGEIVVSVKGSVFPPGDLVGVYFGSMMLVKHVSANEGRRRDLDEDGNVYKGKTLNEPCLAEGSKAFGETNIAFPYQVLLCIWKKKEIYIDSRNTSVWCINIDNVVGKIMIKFGSIITWK
ncbi:MAG: signal peptidase I [Clostridia bacterium]|nr:signal peptidase I [Clostridia bacterium]